MRPIADPADTLFQLRGGRVADFPYRDITGPGFWRGRPLYEQGHP